MTQKFRLYVSWCYYCFFLFHQGEMFFIFRKKRVVSSFEKIENECNCQIPSCIIHTFWNFRGQYILVDIKHFFHFSPRESNKKSSLPRFVSIHAGPMLESSGTHVVPTWYPCGNHAGPLWDSCRIHGVPREVHEGHIWVGTQWKSRCH